MKSIEDTLFIEFDDANTDTVIIGIPVMFMSKKTMSSLILEMIGALGKGTRSLLYSNYKVGKSLPG